MPEERNTNIESLMQIVTKGIIEGNNLLRAISQNTTIQTDSGGISGFKEKLDSLGVVLGKRGSGGTFAKGGSDEALKSIYQILISEQKKATRTISGATKAIEKSNKRRKSYSSDMKWRENSPYLGYRRERKSIAGIADFFTGGRTYSDKAIKQMLNKKGIFGGLLARFSPKVMGATLGNMAQGNATVGAGTWGGVFKGALKNLALVGIVEAGKGIVDMFKSAQSALYTGVALSTRGQDMSGIETTRYNASIFAASRMGEDREAYSKRVLQYQNLGLGWRQGLEGLAVEKGYGIQNAGTALQAYYRRTNATAKYGDNLSKAFTALRPIVNKTGLSFNELSEATVGFLSQFKGSNISTDFLGTLLGRYGQFVASGKTNWGEVSSLYNKTQEMGAENLVAAVKFAEAGGYRFKDTTGDTLARAWEVRHIPGDSIQQRGEFYRRQLLGGIRRFGFSSWNQMDDRSKFMFSELLPQMGLGELAKNPNFDEVISKFLGSSGIDEQLVKQMEGQTKKEDIKQIVSNMNAILHPINNIRDYLLKELLDPGEKSKMTASLKDDFIKTKKEERGDNVSIFVSPKLETRVQLTPGVPGSTPVSSVSSVSVPGYVSSWSKSGGGGR